MRQRVLLTLALTLPGLQAASAQERPPVTPPAPGPAPAAPVEDPQARINQLRQRVRDEGGALAEQAAFDLFLTGAGRAGPDLGPEGAHDAFLRDVLVGGGAEARLSVLRALRQCGRFRPGAACRLAQEGLDDPDARVTQLAVGTFPALDDERGSVYAYLRETLVELRRARPGTARGREALALVDAVERMPNPITSVGVLVAVLEERQLARGIEERVRDGLSRMTAQALDGPAEWRKWYDDASKRSLAEWRLEVGKRRDERIKNGEREADRYFRRLLVELQGTPEALLSELQKALADQDVVLSVRRTAIRELGALGKNGNERAVALLRARLGQGGATYDEAKALCIEALGDTGNRALLDDVAAFLAPTWHSRMRIAAAQAIGALQAPAGIEPLLDVLDDPSEPDDLVKASIEALGRIGANQDGRVSTTLRRFAERLFSASNGSLGPATELLATLAKALGAFPYAAGGAEADAVTTLLTRMAAHDDTDVRLFAVGSLGTVNDPDAYPALVARLEREGTAHVKRAIVDAIGQWAIDHPDLITKQDDEGTPRVIPLLVKFLNDPDENMKGKARRRLEELANRPPTFRESLVGLTLVTREILAQNPKRPDLAVPFLVGERGLPALEAVTPANRKAYFELLEVRADGRLDTDAAAALADYDAVIRGLDLGAPTSGAARRLHLGRARALLRVTPPRPKEALAGLAPCFKDCEDPGELWAAALEAAERIKGAEPQALPGLLAPFSPFLPGASPQVQQRWSELLGRAPGASGGGS